MRAFIFGVAVLIFAIAAINLGVRYWNSATVQVDVVTLEGRECAIAASSNGIAMDCWEVRNVF